MASKEFISKLKQAIDLVELIGESVQLRRAGKYLTGLSPLTKEKTPSFFVNPESQTFYCFSSNQGGDAITFLELTKGLSFMEAISELANRAGIPMEAQNKSPEQLARDRALDQERKILFKLNRYAARFYQEQLESAAGAVARDYVQKRAISRDSLLSFGIGFAPESWTSLRDYLLKIKAPMEKAFELGLLRTKGGEKPKADSSNLFDTFRNRLVFPIRDVQGEVIGFGGRWLGASSSEAPKYLNSPESLVYEKEKVLYNLDQAKKSVRESGSVVLVEGYMDCLSMVQAGFPNVVANCGTALTKNQVAVLRRLASKVICLYDSDKAGQAATERAMNLFLEHEGFPLLGAKLPEGKDPDEFLRASGDRGKLQMAEILQNSPALLDIWAEALIRETPKNIQARTEALDKIANKLSKLRDELWIQARLPGLATKLEVEPGLAVEAVRKYRKGFSFGAAVTKSPAKNRPIAPQNFNGKVGPKFQKSKQFQGQSDKRDFGFERKFLANLLREPEWSRSLRERHLQNPEVVLPLLDDPEIARVLNEMLLPLGDGESEESRLAQLSESCRSTSALRNLFAEVMMKWDDDMPVPDLDAALAKLNDEKLKRMMGELQRRIDEADKSGDTAQGEALLLELTELRRKRIHK